MELYGHYDGKVVVLGEPAPSDWKPNQRVKIVPLPSDEDPYAHSNEVLLRIAEMALPGLPPDFSEQHDHYVHGTPKK